MEDFSVLFFIIIPLIVSYKICKDHHFSQWKGLLITFFFSWLGTIGLWLYLKNRKDEIIKRSENPSQQKPTISRATFIALSLILVFFVPVVVIIVFSNPSTTQQKQYEQKQELRQKPHSVQRETIDANTSKRKMIHEELLAASDQAIAEAHRRYPIDITDPNFSMENIALHDELHSKLSDQYRAQVRQKYGITRDEVKSIGREGISKGW